jgi:chaperonin GroEL
MKEKKARVEDALHATRAAVEEGIVPGGGVALIRCLKALENLDLKGDEGVATRILLKALEEPARMIAENAGHDGGVVANRIKEGTGAFGFNADTEQFGDLIADGVIDPTKVVRIALTNAVSISALLLTTECLVAELPEEKEKTPAMPGGGGGGMDMY